MENLPLTDFSPRIYCVDPSLVASPDWDDLLGRCAAMGFDHVLLCGDLVDASFAEVAKLCKGHRLRLLADLSLTRFYAGDPVLTSHADWFAPQSSAAVGLSSQDLASDPLPDPRYPSVMDERDDELVTRRARFDDPVAADAMLDWWRARLMTLVDAGVAGFRCQEPASIPADFWRRLIAGIRQQQADCRFLAWTPGCTHDQLDGLAGIGFDAVFSSGAWWDFRDPWYFREYRKLAAIAPVLAFPEDPSGPRLARVHGFRDPQTRRLGALRALQFATLSAEGWMMPMGFEFGLTAALRVAHRAGSATRLSDPEAFKRACADADLDFTREITEANRTLAQRRQSPPKSLALRLTPLSAPDSPWLLMERHGVNVEDGLLIAVNPALDRPVRITDDGWQQRLQESVAPWQEDGLVLEPGAVKVLPLKPLQGVSGELDQATPALGDMRSRRIAIERVSPAVDDGAFAAKRIVGEHFVIAADIFMDGHDHLAAEVLVRAADEAQWRRIPMHPDVNDRWQARVSLTRLGRHYFCIEAWSDVFDTFRDGLQKKLMAGQDVSLEMEEGRLLIARLVQRAVEQELEPSVLESSRALLKALGGPPSKTRRSAAGKQADTDKRLAFLCAEETRQLVEQLTGLAGERAFLSRTDAEYPLEAERRSAAFSSWYELFPRSQSGSADVHGNFDDVIARLPAIRAMGFDTLYFPPIHPIGKKHRKGKNNSVTAGPDDPGSPYAIGSEEGGHDAIHPQLGTFEDFARLRDAAAAHGLELALD